MSGARAVAAGGAVAVVSAADEGTAARALDVAERLAQERGYNAFSYADIAAELGVTKPALHYHYANKAALGVALIERYAARFADALRRLDDEGRAAPAKLAAYADLYLDVLSERRMCLCGMLAAEYSTLPAPMQRAVLAFFDGNEAWLAGVLDQGAAEGTVQLREPARDGARIIISGLEGALLIARPYGDPTRFRAAADRLIAGFLVDRAPAGGAASR